MTGSRAKRLRWRQALSPFKVDIVGDFAGKELFAIHGDAMMLHCLSNARVDYRTGFQLLHAVHAVETFLANLKTRGCNFHVVWFRDHEQLCVPANASEPGVSTEKCYRLTRAIIIKHLQRHAEYTPASADCTPLFEFQDVDCDEFQKYREQHAIHFFMCFDGYALNGRKGVLYLDFMHILSFRGYSIALINNLEFVSSKVLANVFSPSTGGVNKLPIEELWPESRTPFKSLSELQTDSADWSGDWSPWQDGKPLSARDMVSLTCLCNMLLTGSQTEIRGCVAAYILHLCVVRRCRLSQRSCAITPLDKPQQACLDNFLASFADVCISVVESFADTVTWDLFDLLDGRILRQIFGNLESLAPSWGIADEARKLAERVNQLTHVDVSEFIPPCPVVDGETPPPMPDSIDSDNESHGSVLHFSQPILDRYLEPIHLVAEDSQESTGKQKIFQELSHWHNARVPLDPKHVPRPRGFFARRKNQKWMAKTIAYSASLTNASGKIINPETIVSVSTADSDRKGRERDGANTRPKPLARHPKTKTNKGGGREKALEMAQGVKRKKAEDRAAAVTVNWDKRSHELQAEAKGSLAKHHDMAAKYLADLSKEDMAVIGAEASLYVCNILASTVLECRRRRTMTSELGLLAMIWSRIREAVCLPLSPESLAQLQLFAKALRLPTTMAPVPSLGRRPLPFSSVMAAAGAGLKLLMDAVVFQLEYCGPYLERSFDSEPDARVPNFSPDAWQRRVLDAIDADKSLFVVAPTSAGKTFISFYAMKKVLQSSDDGVLVYVAPTKALVNQIAAEIQARFSKSYSHEGRSVWAIHTRDYRVNNPRGCQVLVTVPHILQLMLLAPSNAEKATSWSLKVRRIIFDEVHCIGQAEDGVIWEQLLLLAPCPIVALSATVGNPLEFKAWLEASQRVKGFELEMIMHSSRYSDLRKFYYEPPKREFVFRGLKVVEGPPIPGLDRGRAGPSPFSIIHPVASLVNRNRGTIDDISLEPRDCLTLWQCMSKHQTELYPVDDALDPRRALPDIVRKADVVEWERALKKILGKWLQDPRSPFSAVRDELVSAVLEPFQDSKVTPKPSILDPENPSDFEVKFKIRKNALGTNALPLLVDLHSRGGLPAILFNYNRSECVDILLAILDQLQRAEDTWKGSNREWSRKCARYEQRMRARALQKSRGRSQDDDGLSRIDMIREETSKEASAEENFDPKATEDMFSFADKTKLSDSELREIIDSLREANTKPRIIAALRRGMGVHHSGMNRAYRQVVEMLFRKGFLTVVVATGTLALGINMPCKTVVFLGDSVFLTSLNYLQAAGRAGRRGFDLLGNVVFAGMPVGRVFEIMSSRLPDLRGHFPLSTTLVLRLLGLLHHTGSSEFTVKAVDSLLSQTRLYLGGPSNQLAIKHHLRFSIEYLRRQHLLSRDGAPLNFSGLVGHLYFTENATFAFHSLLKEGYFHRICGAANQQSGDVLLELMLVLSHLFCRIPVLKGGSEWYLEVVHRSPSIVMLPRLPTLAEEILVQHNRDTLDIFRTYVSTFVEQHLGGEPDNQLPLTKFAVERRQGQHGSQEGLSMLEHLTPTRLRSPFAALSGFTDEFDSIHELCSTVRSGVFLDESAVPYIPIYPRDTAGVPWNAYIYDFFKHGDLEALVRDNEIKSGDVWFHLKDFSLVLATIVTSLTNFFSLESSLDDAAMMDVQDVGDVMQEGRDESDSDKEPEAAAAAAAPDLTQESVTVAPKSTKASKRAVVVDSWEDGVSSDEGGALPSDAEGSTGPAPGTPWGPEPAWQGDGEESLVRVLATFRRLQEVFEDKFRKVWA